MNKKINVIQWGFLNQESVKKNRQITGGGKPMLIKLNRGYLKEAEDGENKN